MKSMNAGLNLAVIYIHIHTSSDGPVLNLWLGPGLSTGASVAW